MHYTKFKTPIWLVGGHIQTIYPAKLLNIPAPDFRRERWTTPDHDFIDIDFIDQSNAPAFVLLFHGLEGSSQSHYARSIMNAIKKQGWSGAVAHFRGCSGELNLAPRFYHSGDAQEIAWITQRMHDEFKTRQPNGRFYVCGVSLGGNALLRYLGEAQQQAGIIDAACAISAPLNLSKSGETLGRGFNKVYTQHFLKTLKPKCEAKLKQYPDLFNARAMREANSFLEFDDAVTAPLHGYRDVHDYWDRASSCHVLEDIRVPSLILNAKNDPFLPGQYLPKKASSYVTLDYHDQGGHVGFTHHEQKQDWLATKLCNFFKQHMQISQQLLHSQTTQTTHHG